MLGDFLQDVQTYGSAWQGVLFRRTYGELEELIARSREIYPEAGATWFEQKHWWVWPNGARLRLRYLERDHDVTRYQGHQYTWIGWDELTQWPTDYPYRYLRGRLRSPHGVPTKRIRAAANPGGAGHQWVRAYFVSPAAGGYVPVFDNLTKHWRMFVPAKLRDNQVLLAADPYYADRLRGLGSEALVAAMLEGDWDVVEGAFFDCWRTERIVVRPFEIPSHWLRFRSGDWGSATPFSFGWWAVASDDHVLNERGVCVPRGAIVRYREWYGSVIPGSNKGIKLPADKAGQGLVERETSDPKLSYGVLDPSVFRDQGGPTIAEIINRELIKARLVPFREADNARIPRKGALGGWDQMRGRMIGDGDERSMIFCFNTCRASIDTIPVMQHDRDNPEDMATDGVEDHPADDWRYACMSRPWVREKQVPAVPDNRSGYRPVSHTSYDHGGSIKAL